MFYILNPFYESFFFSRINLYIVFVFRHGAIGWCFTCAFGIRLRFVPTSKLGEFRLLTCVLNRIELEMNYELCYFFCFSFHRKSATSNHDPWNGLATLMTLLETVVDSNKDYLSLEGGKGEWEIERSELIEACRENSQT